MFSGWDQWEDKWFDCCSFGLCYVKADWAEKWGCTIKESSCKI